MKINQDINTGEVDSSLTLGMSSPKLISYSIVLSFLFITDTHLNQKQKVMKTKHSAINLVSLKLFLGLPLIVLVLIVLYSCSPGKKAVRTTIETALPPPPPPPPPPPVPPQVAVPDQKVGDAYTVVDVMPAFPGGDDALLKYIAVNTRYPKEAKDKNIQGRVITRFMVNEDGTVSDVSVLKGVDTLLDNEAVRVVATIPKFAPGMLNGIAVPVWYMIPISFTLSGNSPQRQSRFEVHGTDTIYLSTNERPSFTGGNEALLKFKAENIKYPPEVKSLGLEGLVVVRFNIEKNGSVSDVRIMQGASPSLDAEAIRVTKSMPAWQPGKEKGKAVKYLYMTSYEFLLTPRKPPVIEEGAPFVVVEEMPVFPGGDSALLAFIRQNTKYPETAKANKVEGRVIVRFCITDTGGVNQVSVLKGIDPDLDAEAIRVVKSLPKFKPGKQGGKPVNVWYMVPITYGLSDPPVPAEPKAPPQPPPPLPQGYDEPPVYKGGETAMFKFINSNLIYPASAKEKNITGKVNMRFSVETDGSISGVSVVKGLYPELDEEAARVIKLLPAWIPGKLEGIPVKVWYSMPVIFTIK